MTLFCFNLSRSSNDRSVKIILIDNKIRLKDLHNFTVLSFCKIKVLNYYVLKLSYRNSTK